MKLQVLDEYLKAQGLTLAAFCKRIEGLNQATVWRVLNGKVIAHPKTARLISQATMGEITENQIMYP